MSTAEFIREIETFLTREDVRLSDTTFGKMAVNDGKFLTRLRAGGGLTMATAERVRAFIGQYQRSNRPRPSHKGHSEVMAKPRHADQRARNPRARAGAP